MTEKERPEEATPEPEEAPEPQPTSAADWPSKEAPRGALVTLPSGAVARIAPPPLTYLYSIGAEPPKMTALLKAEGRDALSDPLGKMSPQLRRVFMDWMIAESFVEPQVAMTRKAGCLYVGDLSDADKAFVMDALKLALV